MDKIRLKPKMVEALEYIDTYRNAGPYKERTLQALVERGLIEHTDRTDAVRAGAAWGYRVTNRGYDVFSSTQRRHMNGRTTSRPEPDAVAPLKIGDPVRQLDGSRAEVVDITDDVITVRAEDGQTYEGGPEDFLRGHGPNVEQRAAHGMNVPPASSVVGLGAPRRPLPIPSAEVLAPVVAIPSGVATAVVIDGVTWTVQQNTGRSQVLAGAFPSQVVAGPAAFDHLPADHPAPVVSPPAYRIRDTYGDRTFLVLGTSPATNAPHLTSVWMQLEGERGVREWKPDMLMGSIVKFVAVDENDRPQARPVQVADVMLYDHHRHEVMHVLGQTFGAIDAEGQEELLFRYENDDQAADAPYRSILFADLYSPRYTAVCPHRLDNQGSRCSACNPFPSTDHLIGELVTLDPVNGYGTVSGHLERVEPTASFDFAVGVLRSGRLVRVTRKLVEMTLANLPESTA